MPSLDDEIDRLYQQPLSAFVRERDALAKRSGADGANIRRLEKPSAAAWAVNQVYWNRRKVFDKLTTASERLRTAHERRLAGKDSDIEMAEAAHRAAVTTAVDEARQFLTATGDAATEATLSAVGETLQTLVWTPLDGRLIRPRKPTGLEALSALMKPGRTIKPAAKVLPMRPPPESRAEAAEREAKTREKEKTQLDKDLRAARAAEAKADAGVTRASAAVDQAVREQTKAEAALEKATAATREERQTLHDARERAKSATAERERIEARLRQI
jgi:hypothetical protein